MVIQIVKPESTYVNNGFTTSPKSSSSPAMSTQVENFLAYLKALDGSDNAAERFEPLFREAIHPDYLLELPGGKNLTYDDLLLLVRAYTKRGVRAQVHEMVDNGDNTATFTIENTLPGEAKGNVTHQRVWFRDGKAVKLVPIESDTDRFGTLVQRLEFFATQDKIADKYTRMISFFDGSPNAYAKAEPIIDDIFSPNLIIEHDGQFKMDFGGFKEWASTFSKECNVAKIEKQEKTEDGIRFWIHNVVDGVDLGVAEQVGRIENGKIVHWASVSNDRASFNMLVTRVAAQAKGSMMGNIQRLSDYLSALDGSSNAWQKFQPHIDRVLARDIVWEDGKGGKSYDYHEVVDLIKHHYIPNGCRPVLESVEDNGDGSLTVVINNHLPGENGDATHQTLHYGSDDLIHKLVSTEFSDTCKRIMALPKTVA